MTLSVPASPQARQTTTVSVEVLAWAVVALVFVGLRLPLVAGAPVGGSEWVHLSGAWNAAIGVDDGRFIPTLFQAITAWSLELSSSEALPRTLAFLATATVPAALYLLRPQLGSIPALLALLLLALDAPALWLGVAATASGFDVAITLWLLVLFAYPNRVEWLWPVAGFVVATAGPLPLALGLGGGAVLVLRGKGRPLAPCAAGAAAALLGILAASVDFGYGWGGLVVPPLDLFASAFDRDATTAPAGRIALLYSWPLIAGGLVAAAFVVRGWRSSAEESAPLDRVLVAWFVVGLAWFAVSLATNAEAPLVAVTMPSALLLGRPLVRGFDAMLAVRAPFAWFGLALILFIAALALIVVVDWARFDRVGAAGEVARVVILGAAAVTGLALLANARSARPALVAVATLVGAIVLVSGASHVAFSSHGEPFPTPRSAPEARSLAMFIEDFVEEQSGPVVVHETLVDQVTWPFRETRPLLIASGVPPGAAVAILPGGHAPPDDMALLDGQWSLERRVAQPTHSLLRYVRWYTDRKWTAVSPIAVDVYVRGDE